MKVLLCRFSFIVMFFAITGSACAYLNIPYEHSNAKFLYVFGPQGNTDYGADEVDHQQRLYIDIPETETSDVVIRVYDPDTGGFYDLKPSPDRSFSTVVEFIVYGKGERVLDKKEFGESAEYDRNYFTFGPYPKEEGEKIGNVYRFRLVANALAGEDENLFNVRIAPDSAEVFSDKVSLRLLSQEGDKMYFYPEVPAGVLKIIVQNYDLDPNGGDARLYDQFTKRDINIEDSNSGQWAETAVDLNPSESPQRPTYVIIKKTQRYANAAIRVKDDEGNILPIYFAQGKPVVVSRVVAFREPVAEPKPMTRPPQPSCNKFTFDATSSYDPNNEKLSYLWDFGDGTTSIEPVVTHVYDKAGEYTVTLTVKNTSGLPCDTAISTQTIRANTPPLACLSAPDKTCVGNEVLFDASSSKSDNLERLTYHWDFGDGSTAEGKQVTKKYEKGGTYKVKLTVNDNLGTLCSVDITETNITVNTPPFADAGEDIQMCIAADQKYTVTFDGEKSKDADGDKLTYTWDFGNGASAKGQKSNHTYKKGGVYTVKLTVDDGSGLPCAVGVDTLNVKLNKQPVANAGPNMVCCVGVTSTFDGSGSSDPDGDTLTYKWDFGDGATAEGVNVTHVYTKLGTYTVVLRVDDNTGTPCSSSTSSFTAKVNEQPVSIIKVR